MTEDARTAQIRSLLPMVKAPAASNACCRKQTSTI